MTPAGVHIVTVKRPGKPIRHYIYAWRGGPKIRVAEQPGKPRLTREDIAQIAEAHAADNTLPRDTLAGVIQAWRHSREWRALAPSTQALWSYALARIEAKWGALPLQVFGDPRITPKIVAWRDAMAATPRAADQHVMVLGQLLAWAMLHGLIACNTASAVPRIWRGGTRAEIIWLPADCAAFDAGTGEAKPPQWLIDTRRLAEVTGLRRADLVALRWTEIFDTHIARTASKKSRGKRRRTVMPIVPGLRELLEELRTRPRQPGTETVLVGAQGKPIKATTLTTEFNRWRGAANSGEGITHKAEFDDETDRAKTLHDLRGTFATKLMTLPGGSLTDDQIATVMGWSRNQVAGIRRRYVDETSIIVAIATRMQAGQV